MTATLPPPTSPGSPPSGLPLPASGQVRRSVRRHGRLVLVILVAVIVLDQAAKWWAWRHVPDSQMNAGGDIFTGSVIGTLYTGRISGAVLDLLDFAVLGVVVSSLARFRLPVSVVFPGTLMAAGWGSNLLDRLGLHYWTAPGSVRGAVDFIHVGTYIYNIADIFIVVGTPLFVLAAAYHVVRLARRGRLPRLPRRRLLTHVRGSVLASSGLILIVALGAAHCSGVDTTPLKASVQSGPSQVAPTQTPASQAVTP